MPLYTVGPPGAFGDSTAPSFWSFQNYFPNASLFSQQGSSRFSFSAPNNTATVINIAGGIKFFSSVPAGIDRWRYQIVDSGGVGDGPGPRDLDGFQYVGATIRRSGSNIGTYSYTATMAVIFYSATLPEYTFIQTSQTANVGFNQTVALNFFSFNVFAANFSSTSESYFGTPLNVRIRFTIRENSTGRNFLLNPSSGIYDFGANEQLLFPKPKGGSLFFGHNF